MLWLCRLWFFFLPAALEASRCRITVKAKELTISQWVKGEPADVTDGEHIYVVEFWATWCGLPAKHPHLTELQKKYKDQVFSLLA